MRVEKLAILDLLLVTPDKHGDLNELRKSPPRGAVSS
jgi:hypothetical protein